MSRCIASSLDARRSLSGLPSKSVTASESSVMRPFEVCVGVATTRPSSRRTLTLPSEETTYPRSYNNSPTRTISRRAVFSSIKLPRPDSLQLKDALRKPVHPYGLAGARAGHELDPADGLLRRLDLLAPARLARVYVDYVRPLRAEAAIVRLDE